MKFHKFISTVDQYIVRWDREKFCPPYLLLFFASNLSNKYSRRMQLEFERDEALTFVFISAEFKLVYGRTFVEKKNKHLPSRRPSFECSHVLAYSPSHSFAYLSLHQRPDVRFKSAQALERHKSPRLKN